MLVGVEFLDRGAYEFKPTTTIFLCAFVQCINCITVCGGSGYAAKDQNI